MVSFYGRRRLIYGCIIRNTRRAEICPLFY
nr:MAG TPA: hypothetical protein [Bacteriophage sp.]